MTITIWLFSHLKGSDYITRLDSVQDRSGVTMCMTSSIYEFIETRMRLCYSGKLVSFSTTDGILLSTFTNHFCTQRLLQIWLWLPCVHLSFLWAPGPFCISSSRLGEAWWEPFLLFGRFTIGDVIGILNINCNWGRNGIWN